MNYCRKRNQRGKNAAPWGKTELLEEAQGRQQPGQRTTEPGEDGASDPATCKKAVLAWAQLIYQIHKGQ